MLIESAERLVHLRALGAKGLLQHALLAPTYEAEGASVPEGTEVGAVITLGAAAVGNGARLLAFLEAGCERDVEGGKSTTPSPLRVETPYEKGDGTRGEEQVQAR